MMPINDAVFDTSFWINADRAGLLEDVLARFKVWYVPAVAAEINDNYASGRKFRRLVQDGTLTEIQPREQRIVDFGIGERIAISVAIEHPDWMLLIDDLRPSRVAGELGLNVITTPGFVATLFGDGHLDATQTLTRLGRLAGIQTVSPQLLAGALVQIDTLIRGKRGDRNGTG